MTQLNIFFPFKEKKKYFAIKKKKKIHKLLKMHLEEKFDHKKIIFSFQPFFMKRHLKKYRSRVVSYYLYCFPRDGFITPMINLTHDALLISFYAL